MTDTEHRTTSGSNEEKEAKGVIPLFSTTKGNKDLLTDFYN